MPVEEIISELVAFLEEMSVDEIQSLEKTHLALYERAKLRCNQEKAAMNEWELANPEFKPWNPTYLQLNQSLYDAERVWKIARLKAAAVDETKDASIEQDKAKWRYDKVRKGLTEWEQDHPGFKTWNIQHIQLKMLLGVVENRWKEAQEVDSIISVDGTARRSAVENALRMCEHVSGSLREWEMEHPNYDSLDPERGQLLELLREADRRFMVARAGGSKKKRKKYSELDIEESCRKFLNAVATKFAQLYDFPLAFETSATIEDLFRAIDGNKWKPKSPNQVSLRDFYPKEVWKTLRQLHEDTSYRMRIGKPVRNERGEIVVVLPHDGFEVSCRAVKKAVQICAQWGDWDPTPLF
ncbi:unnamed protein product [Aphanomyces euteiches]